MWLGERTDAQLGHHATHQPGTGEQRQELDAQHRHQRTEVGTHQHAEPHLSLAYPHPVHEQGQIVDDGTKDNQYPCYREVDDVIQRNDGFLLVQIVLGASKGSDGCQVDAVGSASYCRVQFIHLFRQVGIDFSCQCLDVRVRFYLDEQAPLVPIPVASQLGMTYHVEGKVGVRVVRLYHGTDGLGASVSLDFLAERAFRAEPFAGQFAGDAYFGIRAWIHEVTVPFHDADVHHLHPFGFGGRLQNFFVNAVHLNVLH